MSCAMAPGKSLVFTEPSRAGVAFPAEGKLPFSPSTPELVTGSTPGRSPGYTDLFSPCAFIPIFGSLIIKANFPAPSGSLTSCWAPVHRLLPNNQHHKYPTNLERCIYGHAYCMLIISTTYAREV